MLGDRWTALVTRLLEPVPVSLGEFLALCRVKDLVPPADRLALRRLFPVNEHHFDYALALLYITREATPMSPGIRPASAYRLAYLRVLQNSSLAELQDMATKKNIPYDGKAATTLRLDLAGWVQRYPFRLPEMDGVPPAVRGIRSARPQADSTRALIKSCVDADLMHLRRKTMRRDYLLTIVRQEVDKTRHAVRSCWGDESPTYNTNQSATVMLWFLEEDYAQENGDGDLSGQWSQEEEDIGETRITRLISSDAAVPAAPGGVPATAVPERGIPVTAVLPPARIRCMQEMIVALEAERGRLQEKVRQQEALLQSVHGEVGLTTNTHKTTTPTNNGPTYTAV